MSNIFWAVFFGSALGTLLVYLVTTIIDEYIEKRSHERYISLLGEIEDADFDDWE